MSLPQVCASYNVPPLGCRNGSKCPDLHVCKNFVLRCCLGKKCQLCHDIFSKQPLKVMLKYQMDVGRSPDEILVDLKQGITVEEENETELSSEEESDDYYQNDDYEDYDSDNASVFKGITDNKNSLKQLATCKFYNNETGCRFGDKCENLHLCYHYLRKRCKYASQCRRSHNILDPQPRKVLQQFDISIRQRPEAIIAEVCGKLKFKDPERIVGKDKRGAVGAKSYSGAQTASGATCGRKSHQTFTSGNQGGSTPNPLELCIFHLMGKCTFGEKCVKYHARYGHPYVWRWRLHKGSTEQQWVEFDEDCQQEIETCYCDPEIDDPQILSMDGKTQYLLDFTTMMCSVKTASNERVTQLQRLSSKSAIGSTSGYIYLTNWLWYWADGKGHWIKYGFNADGQEIIGCVTSQDIEAKFEANPKVSVCYKLDSIEYELNFQSMVQISKSSKAQTQIKRRPALFNAETKRAMPDFVGGTSAQISRLALD